MPPGLSDLDQEAVTLNSDGILAQDIPLKVVGDVYPTPRILDTSPFPAEILQLIFQRLIPPHWMLNYVLSAGYNSSWCTALRQKKCLLSVCRSWYAAGLPFLYEDICLRYVPQLQVLFRTIKTAPAARGALVKTLNIHCYVPHIFASEFTKYLETLFPLLPRLSTFAYTSFTPLPISATIPTLPGSITRLRLEGISPATLVEILRGANTTLNTLWVSMPHIDRSLSEKITLPSVRSLFLEPDINDGDDDNEHEFDFVTRNWELPCLSGCTFSIQGTRNRNDDTLSNAVVSFLTKHGTNLKFLHLHPSLFQSSPDLFLPSVRQLQQHCPHLEHLIIPPCVFTDPDRRPPIFIHPTLKRIDFWQKPEGERGRSSKYWLSRTPVSCNDLPALEGARTLSGLPRGLFEWLETFPPDAVTKTNQTFAIDAFENELVHGVGHVTWRRPDWTMDFDYDPGTESDFSSSDDHDGAHNGSVSLSVWDKIGWKEYDTESSDGSYRYETESESTDELASDIETEEGDITPEDDATMDLLIGHDVTCN